MKNEKSKKIIKTGAFTVGVVTAMTVAPYVMDVVELNEAKAAEGIAFHGGSGTAADPYQIATVEQLKLVHNNYTSHFKLVADIDLNYENWSPIGNKDLPFKGFFDGDGHTIKNLAVSSATGYAGLFGRVEGGYIKNLNIENADVTANDDYAGILVGYANKAAISNIEIKSSGANNNVFVTATGRASHIGGVAGYVAGEHNVLYGAHTMEKIVFNGAVQTDSGSYIGGVVGSLRSGSTASEIIAKGDIVSTSGSDVGGITGQLDSADIFNAMSYANVEGADNIGGIAGSSTSGNIQYVFSMSNVLSNKTSGTIEVGGLVGAMTSDYISQAFAFNAIVDGPTADRTGKAFGTIGSSVTKTQIVIYDAIDGNNHSTGVTTTMVASDFTSETRYKRYGIRFDIGVWGIIDGQTQPFLLFHPISSYYDPTEGEWIHTPISKDELYGADAEEAVRLAEQMKQAPYVISAQTLVDKLDDGDTKASLNERLDVVRIYVNALEAVEQAEYYLTQAKVDAAQMLVDKVVNADDKAYLQQRLDAIKLLIQEQDNLYQQALAAVELAERTFETGDIVKTQADKDAAQLLVDKLNDSDRKTALQVRLDALQSKIDEEKAKQEAEKAINAALEAVEKAERTKLQVDVDTARPLVNALPNGADKTNLTDRLNAVQAYIDALNAATRAVEEAEIQRTQAYIDTAQNLVDKLPQDNNRAALQARLDAIRLEIQQEKDNYLALKQKIQAIHDGVVNETITVDQYPEKRVELENYRLDVNKLKNADNRSELNNLIDLVLQLMIETENEKARLEQLEADAEGLVAIAEQSIALTDINNADVAVIALPDSDKKQELTQRLDVVKELYQKYKAAEDAVKAAELNPSATTVENAQPKIDVLPEGERKKALQARLDAVLEGLFADAEAKVANAEKVKTQEAIDTAQLAINKLPVGQKRDKLQARLDAVKADVKQQEENDKLYEEALKAVQQAEATPTVSNIDFAQGKINAMNPDDTRKADLQARLDAVLEGLFADAEAKVAKAEGTRNNTDIATAYTAVNILPDGDRKQSLIDRLEALKQAIEDDSLYEEALKAVQQAEATPTVSNIDFAQGKIDAMNSNDARKAELQTRLDAVLEGLFADAEAKVAKAENQVNSANISSAQSSIDKLPDGERKNVLQARLDAVKEQLKMDGLYEEALKAVIEAEKNTNASTIGKAQSKIDAMNSNDTRKAELQARLDAAYEKLKSDAIASVEKAETTKSQADVDAGRTIVNKLPAGDLKTELTARLDAIQEEIKKKEEMDNLYDLALAAIIKAEQNKTILNISNADKAVQKVKNEDVRKPELVKRLEALYYHLQLEEAKKAVTDAERFYKTNPSKVSNAQNLVNALKDSADKDALQARLDAIYKLIDDANYEKALALVKSAEMPAVRKKVVTLQAAIDKAQPAIDILLESERKKDLQSRLDALKAQLDELKNKNGKYNPGEDIVEVAQSIIDETASNYFVELATKLVYAEATLTTASSNNLRAAYNAVPLSYLENPQYATLVEEIELRMAIVNEISNKFGTPFGTGARSVFANTLRLIDAFEKNRTLENYNAAKSAIDLAAQRQNVGDIIDLLIKRLNRVTIESN